MADEASFVGAGAPHAEFGIANPGGIVAYLTARHCAGLSYRPDAQSVLDYLLSKTEGTPEMEWAIRSLHGTNFVLIRFLNQFAVPRAPGLG